MFMKPVFYFAVAESRLAPYFDYLNSQLAILLDNLYAGVFKQVLKRIFQAVMKDLESRLLPFSLKNKVDRYVVII